MALSLEQRADPRHGMLVVVDMQNDFFAIAMELLASVAGTLRSWKT